MTITGLIVHNDCKVEGKPHGSETHQKRIGAQVETMKNSGNYSEIYLNKALKTAGLNGTQDPISLVLQKLEWLSCGSLQASRRQTDH